MTPRTLSFAVLATLLAFGSPTFAKDKPKPMKDSGRTWKTVAEHVLKNGAESTLKAPSSRMLGFDSDAVPAKALRIKSGVSKDKKEHAVHVTFDKNEKGKLIPKDIILGVTLVNETPSGKTVEGYKIRVKLDGSIVSVMRAGGIVGEVKQTMVAPDSEEALTVYKSESTLHLKDNKLEQLTQ
jgi:RNase P/RNase MRP subunit p29